MNTASLRFLSVIVILILLLPAQRFEAKRAADEDGRLLVLVAWGDADHSPATDAYVEAHGWVDRYYSNRSYVLKGVAAGRYEASLPPGLYDLFVSESSSSPVCKRLLVRAGSTNTWTVNLEIDHANLQK
jgi:hypothetical protein